MPTYGYECLSCDNQFEIFQSIKDDALTACAECGGTLRKRIYPVGISFKGSGFYVNDYAPKAAGESGGGDAVKTDTKTEAASAEPKGETKSESKAEPAAASKPEAKSDKPEAKTPAAA